jgi:hypothetical protein
MVKLYKFFSLAAFILVAANLHAQLIFAENFEYPVGNLEGRNGGTGFSSAWSKANTNTAALIGADTKAQVLAGSIGTRSLGNRVQFCLDSGKSVRLDRQFPITLNGATGTNYWLGFWYRVTTDTSSSGTTNTTGLAAQLCLMGPANNVDAWAQRLQFGKHAVGGTTNAINVASRAAGCSTTGTGTGATSWGTGITSKGTYYILVKITKGDSSAAGVLSDGIRMWVLDAPPANEAALAATPNGNTPMGRILTRVLRGDNNTMCTFDGSTGIRIRVEGTGNTAFCAEFDELRLGTSLNRVVGVKEASEYFGYELAPNPASEQANLNLNIKKSGNADIGLYDMLGKRISTLAKGHFTEGGQTIPINTTNLATGVYFVKMNMEGAFQTTKLVVAR